MFLDYLSLALLVSGLTFVFYGFIHIHDIPYSIAKKNNHPQKEAIHVACWLSLFTLHAIWPIVFIWSIMKPKPIEVSIASDGAIPDESVKAKLNALEARLEELEHAAPVAVGEEVLNHA